MDVLNKSLFPSLRPAKPDRLLEAKFDDFIVITGQPIRYNSPAASPFDYFLASSDFWRSTSS
ncbi:hypothetical protein [Marinobacterium sedimentorum]|uniref:hypothetical protein n=1 Tax=Marinobacterium sedimentorum TaxID=2927804 RepID=UPI0020C66DB1|nr:hypothetical protein [Marinobacterium sedimentorum]MCP8688918.1 hypothetical protein [Marinobacterium sedimentorum]